MRSVLPLPLLLIGGAALATACDDPFDVDATFPVNTDTLTVYALDNVEGNLYSGISIVTLDDEGEVGPEVVAIVSEGGGGPRDFDLAVDIAPDGDAIFYPVTLVAPGAASREVRIAASDLPFDQIPRAPDADYQSDEPIERGAGQVLLVEAFSNACALSYNARGRSYFAKLVVDSVRTTPVERVFVRVTSDPNCGFRSFGEGIPGS